MSSKKFQIETIGTTKVDVDAVLSRMKDALGIKEDGELGVKLCVQSSTTFKVWRNRKSIPQSYYAYVSEKTGKSIAWLKTGMVDGLHAVTAAPTEKRLSQPELAALSKEVFGDAPARLAQNPNAEFEARLKRVAEMSQVTTRIYGELGYMPSSEWVSLIQMLLFDRHLDEAGAKQIVELLKRQT